MNNKIIYTYAFIKLLYDEGNDYLDAFWPFAVQSIPNDKGLDLTSIQNNINDKFELIIPLNTLKTILKRATNKNYIEKKEKIYKLTDNGVKYKESIESQKEIERRINALINDIQYYFNKRDNQLNEHEVSILLISFLKKNIDPLVEFINPSSINNGLRISSANSNDTILIDYIKEAEHQKPEYYNTLQDMVIGSLISVIINVDESSPKTDINSKGFKNCTVYLDTNFVFSILELHDPEFNEPAKELFSLLKKNQFAIKVFDFTIDEICNVIKGYRKYSNRYPMKIRVDTIYSSLKRKGWKITDAQVFIANIENTLKNKGIEIEWNTNVDINTYQPKNEELRNSISKYKDIQNISTINHDIAAIEKVIEIRNKPVRKIEDSKAIFLTSDISLSRFNFIEMGHKDYGTICEVILDRLLSDILWLKDPNLNISLNSIISIYSRNQFVNKTVWNKFYDVLQELKNKGSINDNNISILFYNKYIEEELRNFSETNIDSITPEFVIEKIEEVSQKQKDDIQKRIEEKGNEIHKQMEEAITLQEQENNKNIEKLITIKKEFRKKAEKKAKHIFIVRTIFILFIIIMIIIVPYICLKKRGNEAILGYLISILFGGGIIGKLKKEYNNIINKLTDRIYHKYLKQFKLEE